MTTSIPTFLPETIVPAGAPGAAVTAAALPGPMPAAALPDFAGLLAGATPAATPVPGTAAMVAPSAGEMPVVPRPSLGAVAVPVIAPVALANTPVTPGFPAGAPQPPTGGAATRMVLKTGETARAGEAAILPAGETAGPMDAPTRAEQEEAMAMLSALFPQLPAAAPAALPAAPAEPAGPAVFSGNPVATDRPAWPEAAEAPMAIGATGAALVQEIGQTHGSEVVATPVALAGPDRRADVFHSKVSAHPPRALETSAVSFPVPAGEFPVTPGSHESPEAHESHEPGQPEGTDLPAPAPGINASGPRLLGAVMVRADGVRLASSGQPEAEVAEKDPRVGENSAGRRPVAGFAPGVENRAAGKKLLTASEQQLAEVDPEGGTTTANAAATMPPRSSPFPPVPAHGPVAGVKASEAFPMPAPSESPAVAAPRVLATVLEVVEAQESSRLRPAPSVHLRLQVAGETVGLRVELRDEVVRTHFTAVSPELRAALAREWQAARSEAPEGAPRLLDPVFPAPADRGGSAPAGHDAASHQQQHARSWGLPWETPAPAVSRRARGPAAPEPAAAAVPAADERLLSAIA